MSKIAEELLHQAEKRVHITKIDEAKVINPEKDVLMSKKRGINARMCLMRARNKSVPSYDMTFYDPTLIDYGKSIIYFMNTFIGSKKKLWKFIPAIISIENLLLRLL